MLKYLYTSDGCSLRLMGDLWFSIKAAGDQGETDPRQSEMAPNKGI